MEPPKHYILNRWTLGVRYRVGHTSADTSQTSATTCGPTDLDLWNLRQKLDKAYEDAKEDLNDATTLLNF